MQHPPADEDDAITTWRTTVENHVHRISTASDELGVNMRRYYQDDAARARTDQALAEIQRIHEQLAAVTPPPSHQALHNLVLDATKDCSTAMDAYRAAFANNNANEDAPKGVRAAATVCGEAGPAAEEGLKHVVLS